MYVCDFLFYFKFYVIWTEFGTPNRILITLELKQIVHNEYIDLRIESLFDLIRNAWTIDMYFKAFCIYIKSVKTSYSTAPKIKNRVSFGSQIDENLTICSIF